MSPRRRASEERARVRAPPTSRARARAAWCTRLAQRTAATSVSASTRAAGAHREAAGDERRERAAGAVGARRAGAVARSSSDPSPPTAQHVDRARAAQVAALHERRARAGRYQRPRRVVGLAHRAHPLAHKRLRLVGVRRHEGRPREQLVAQRPQAPARREQARPARRASAAIGVSTTSRHVRGAARAARATARTLAALPSAPTFTARDALMPQHLPRLRRHLRAPAAAARRAQPRRRLHRHERHRGAPEGPRRREARRSAAMPAPAAGIEPSDGERAPRIAFVTRQTGIA